jgi:hypothetical protein
LWQMSSRYHVRPSTLVDLEDAHTAWCLDEAVFAYGMGVEAAMKQAESAAPTQETRNGARYAKLRQLLTYDRNAPVTVAPAARYADPANLFGSPRVKKAAKA